MPHQHQAQGQPQQDATSAKTCSRSSESLYHHAAAAAAFMDSGGVPAESLEADDQGEALVARGPAPSRMIMLMEQQQQQHERPQPWGAALPESGEKQRGPRTSRSCDSDCPSTAFTLDSLGALGFKADTFRTKLVGETTRVLKGMRTGGKTSSVSTVPEVKQHQGQDRGPVRGQAEQLGHDGLHHGLRQQQRQQQQPDRGETSPRCPRAPGSRSAPAAAAVTSGSVRPVVQVGLDPQSILHWGRLPSSRVPAEWPQFPPSSPAAPSSSVPAE